LEVKQQVEDKARKTVELSNLIQNKSTPTNQKPQQKTPPKRQATWHCSLALSVKAPESCMQKFRKYHSITVQDLI